MPSHLNVKGNKHADDPVLRGRLQHSNHMLPVVKAAAGTKGEDLRLEPMEEAEGLQVTSDVDSGGRGGGGGGRQ